MPMKYSLFNKNKIPYALPITKQSGGTLINDSIQLQPNCLTTFSAESILEDSKALEAKKVYLMPDKKVEQVVPVVAKQEPTVKPKQNYMPSKPSKSTAIDLPVEQQV